MDFFSNQDNARKQSKTLGVMFIASIIGVVIAVYCAYYFLFIFETGRAFFHPDLALIGAIVSVIIMIVALINWFKLKAGGDAIAESLGGEKVSTNPEDPKLQQLLNVVEEIALAAGTRIPNIYIIETPTVNAFAAGHSVDDAVIGVTRGAVDVFSRDQLQGVIAHEYAHILNGDSAINMKLIALVAGLSFISTAGYYMLYGRNRDGRKVAFALALIVIGAIGAFFANLIKMAISRQREYLADAYAVQYTRNPDGIAGALEVIKNIGSGVESPKASQASHLFFSSTDSGSFLESVKELFSTHPPLDSRIDRIRGK